MHNFFRWNSLLLPLRENFADTKNAQKLDHVATKCWFPREGTPRQSGKQPGSVVAEQIANYGNLEEIRCICVGVFCLQTDDT